MIDVEVPFAVNALDAVEIVDRVGLTAPVLKITLGVVDNTTPSVESLAV